MSLSVRGLLGLIFNSYFFLVEEGTAKAFAANGIETSPAGKAPSPATDLAAVINGNISKSRYIYI
jgi:hypothetical protein